MSITLNLTPASEQKLRMKANSAGLSVESFIDQMLESGASDTQKPKRSFDDIVEPARRAFEESGMTDDDLKEIAEEALREVRQERRARKQP